MLSEASEGPSLLKDALTKTRSAIGADLEAGWNFKFGPAFFVTMFAMSKCRRDDSVLLIVDLQEKFLAPIIDKDAVLHRAKFLIEAAKVLEVPILATEQYATRMGSTVPEVLELLGDAPRVDKLCFSACGSDGIFGEFEKLGKKQVVVVGIETHICVTQSCLDFVAKGFEVFLPADAVSCRIRMAQEIALKRLRHAGVVVTHSESVVYEWMHQAGTEEFKKVLYLVKRYG